MDLTPASVILSREHFILSKPEGTLWCDRRDGRLTAGTTLQKDTASDYVDLGLIWGVIGKLCFFTDGDWKLIVITQASLAGTLPQGRSVYCVDRIGILPLSVNFDMSTDLIGFEVSETSEVSYSLARPPSPGPPGIRPKRSGTGLSDKEKSKEVREREKVEKRLTEALLSMFNESQSFYFSLDFDLTRSLQRQLETPDEDKPPLLWKQMDVRFFWNKWMISELLDKANNSPKLAAEWILPVIQGYVEVRRIPVMSEDAPDILQPGWTKQYREEREKYLKECMEGEAAKKRGSRKDSKELELQNMASASKDKLNIPLKTMTSSGFVYESESDNASEDDSSEFSPVRFTDSVGNGETAVKHATGGKIVAGVVDDDLSRKEDRTRQMMAMGSGHGRLGGYGDGLAGEECAAGEEEGLWCVVEKQQDVIRARICSNADIMEGNRGGGGELKKGGGEGEIERGGRRELATDGSGDVGVRKRETLHGDGTLYEDDERKEKATQDGDHLTGGHDTTAVADPSNSTRTGSPDPVPPRGGLEAVGSPEELLSECPGSDTAVMQDSSEQDTLESGSAVNQDSQSPSVPDEGTDTCRREENKVVADSGTEEKDNGVVMEDRGAPEDVGEDQNVLNNTIFSSDTGVKNNDQHHGDADQEHGRTNDNRTDDGGGSNCESTEHAPSDGKEEEEESDSRPPERSSLLSPTRYFKTTELEEVGCVVVDLLDVQGDSLEEVTRSVMVEQPRTHGETTSEVMVDEFPEDLSSPVKNPFLGQQSSPSWSRHERALSKERELLREEEDVPTFTIAVISRRSCHRAGTRYRRRGVDSEGHVANYVETELVVKCGSHVVSYVIVRGSVPVYWSQPGYKYRPLPVIEKSEEDTQTAFHKHFEQQLTLFKEMVVVNLVKQSGREKLVGDAFEHHILLLDNPLLTYVTFDFHQSYKTNQTVALQKLLDGTAEFIKKFKFCWVDTAQSCGPLCKQEGVFRVNCMDCLDRTNVVESIFSREVLQMALQKLGVLPFEESLGGSTLISYQEMWANNGDIISKQYAGTAAMKGDITRYGERKISGMMKDGYNSAHRYYINIFRDSYRQVLIDLMQGVNPFEAFASLPRSLQGMDELEDSNSLVILQDTPTTQAWSLEREEAVADIISHCEAELFPNLVSSPLHSWILMEPAGMSFMTDNKEDEPCVVIYCKERAQLCVAKCDMDAKKVICFLRIPIFQVQRLVIGQLGALMRNNKRLHMRVHYSLIEGSNVYFTFTTLNQMSPNEERAILVSIAEFLASLHNMISIQEQKITKKRSPTHQGIVYLVPPAGSDVALSSMPHTATPMSSITSAYSSISSPNSMDTKERERTSPLGQHLSVENIKEASFSAPSSPKAGRTLHRRQRSQSLDNIIKEDSGPSKLLSLGPNPTVRIHSPTTKLASPQFKIVDSEEDSDSELDSDEGLEKDEEVGLLPYAQKQRQQNIELLAPGSSRESEEEGEEDDAGSVGAKLSLLKGKFLSKMKSSKNSFLPRPRSHSPQPINTSSLTAELSGVQVTTTTTSSNASGSGTQNGEHERSNEAEGGGDDSKVELGKGSQWVGAMKQRFRMNSPNLWRKRRRISPAGVSALVPEDEDLAKSEEAHKNCKTRMIFL